MCFFAVRKQTFFAFSFLWIHHSCESKSVSLLRYFSWNKKYCVSENKPFSTQRSDEPKSAFLFFLLSLRPKSDPNTDQVKWVVLGLSTPYTTHSGKWEEITKDFFTLLWETKIRFGWVNSVRGHLKRGPGRWRVDGGESAFWSGNGRHSPRLGVRCLHALRGRIAMGCGSSGKGLFYRKSKKSILGGIELSHFSIYFLLFWDIL